MDSVASNRSGFLLVFRSLIAQKRLIFLSGQTTKNWKPARSLVTQAPWDMAHLHVWNIFWHFFLRLDLSWISRLCSSLSLEISLLAIKLPILRRFTVPTKLTTYDHSNKPFVFAGERTARWDFQNKENVHCFGCPRVQFSLQQVVFCTAKGLFRLGNFIRIFGSGCVTIWKTLMPVARTSYFSLRKEEPGTRLWKAIWLESWKVRKRNTRDP